MHKWDFSSQIYLMIAWRVMIIVNISPPNLMLRMEYIFTLSSFGSDDCRLQTNKIHNRVWQPIKEVYHSMPCVLFMSLLVYLLSITSLFP